MKTKSLLSAALMGFIATAPSLKAAITYETIVQWGELGGEDIVSDVTNGQNAFGTTYDLDEVNPSSGSNGYYITDPSERTSVFHGAQAQAFGGSEFVSNGAPNFDYVQIVANSTAAFEAMAAWNVSDGFLNSQPGPVLESFDIEFQRRGAGGADISFLLETSNGWYVTDTIGAEDGANWTTFSLDADSTTWSSFSGFSVSGGGGSPDFSDIVSVGFRVESDAVSGWDGARVRYFEVTAAVPEPSSTALLGLGGVALLLRRRRS